VAAVAVDRIRTAGAADNRLLAADDIGIARRDRDPVAIDDIATATAVDIVVAAVSVFVEVRVVGVTEADAVTINGVVTVASGDCVIAADGVRGVIGPRIDRERITRDRVVAVTAIDDIVVANYGNRVDNAQMVAGND